MTYFESSLLSRLDCSTNLLSPPYPAQTFRTEGKSEYEMAGRSVGPPQGPPQEGSAASQPASQHETPYSTVLITLHLRKHESTRPPVRRPVPPAYAPSNNISSLFRFTSPRPCRP
ncbi:uncharacterized protein BKA78DRAFT_301005 [Phyllosticta capitalensis]|uniref:uncharacterized protein n=1 Tax=Phyllosticta capitalensis TaxID=121624 RepID=UPI00312F5B77